MKKFLLFYFCLIIFLSAQNLSEEEVDFLNERNYLDEDIEYLRKPDIGFFFGSSNPFPNTAIEKLLEPTLDFGLFARFPLYKLYGEVAIKSNTYLSESEAAAMIIPIFFNFAYELPINIPLDLFVKAGGGTSYVVTRPSNLARWNPMGFLGFETSFVTANTVRIGLRIDYNIISETHLKNKNLLSDYLFLQASTVEPRFYQIWKKNRLYNPQFFDFNLAISFFL